MNAFETLVQRVLGKEAEPDWVLCLCPQSVWVFLFFYFFYFWWQMNGPYPLPTEPKLVACINVQTFDYYSKVCVWIEVVFQINVSNTISPGNGRVALSTDGRTRSARATWSRRRLAPAPVSLASLAHDYLLNNTTASSERKDRWLELSIVNRLVLQHCLPVDLSTRPDQQRAGAWLNESSSGRWWPSRGLLVNQSPASSCYQLHLFRSIVRTARQLSAYGYG